MSEPSAQTKAVDWSNTSCWDCIAVYPMSMPKCPACGATNANADFESALTQMNQRRQDQERKQ